MWEFWIHPSTMAVTTEAEGVSRLQTERWWKVRPELSLANLGFNSKEDAWKEPLCSCTNQKALSWPCSVSFVIICTQMQRAKCSPPSVLKFRPTANANSMSVESILLFESPDATYAMGQQPKAVGVHKTQASHLYSPGLNPAIPAESASATRVVFLIRRLQKI